MNFRRAMMNDKWPEFVTEEEATITPQAEHTGWETVVFELEEYEIDGLLSVLDA